MNKVARWMFAGSVCLCAGLRVHAQSRPDHRFPLDGAAVARALHADGFDVQPGQLHMPMALSSSVDAPSLELAGADRLPDGHMRLRLRCHKAGDCLPFSVTVERTARADADRSAQPVAATPIPPASMLLAAVATPHADVPQPATEIFGAPVTPASIHAGAKLTLLLEDGHMHIHLPVVALDTSAVGSEIRVATLDRKQTFRATVIDPGTVRGGVQ